MAVLCVVVLLLWVELWPFQQKPVVLEFASGKADQQPLRFEIHDVLLRDVGWNGGLSYHVYVSNLDQI